MKKITLLFSLLITSIGFSQELVTNGDFQTGVAAPWTGNAANPVDLGGGNYFNQANVSAAGAAYAVNLSQEILLNNGTTYTLTFDAFTDTDTGSRTMLAGLGQTGAPWEALTETVNLTPTSQTFTYTFTINYGDAVTDRVLFDMGADTGFVFIDNVSVQEFVDTEAPTDFTASVGTVGAMSVELLLNATDNSGSVTYDVTYGATTTQATGVSGVETSVTINGLTPETAYTFSVSASDSSSNSAANNPIELSATTVEDTNTACAGTSSSAVEGSFGDSTFDYAFETLTNGNVKMTFTLNQPGLVAYAWNQSPFSETPMTVTGNVATLELTGLSEGDVINKAVKFVWAAGGFAVTQYFAYTVGDDCEETPDEDNVTLSDLQLDGTTIDGFSGSTISYDVVVNEPGATIPVVSATAAFGTVGAITQASEIPGTATFEVTSQSTNFTQTYTVNFVFVGPQTAAPIPPAREASDVISFYSDAYSATGLTNFDAGWCGANSVTEISVEANAVMAWNTNPCQGIEFTAIDATSFTNLHFDLYIAAETDMIGKVFNLKFVETSSGVFQEINFNSGSSPAIVAGQWNSVDVEVDLSDYEALDQFAVTSNLNNLAWYDNMYIWKAATAGLEGISANATKMYPNPAKGVVNFSSASNVALDVAVYDMLGKQVLRANAVQSQLNISSLNPGVYFVKMNQGAKSVTKKLLVN